MTTNHMYPAGVMTKLHAVRTAVSHIPGVHVEAFARGIIVSTRPNDRQGASRISRAHAALRRAAIERIVRQAPNVLKISVPRRRHADKITRD